METVLPAGCQAGSTRLCPVVWETHQEQNPPLFRRSQMVIRVIIGIGIVICERTVLKKMNIGKS